jgi:hypothetical protein
MSTPARTRHSPILGDCPDAVRAAWDAYLSAWGDPASYQTERRTPERSFLEWRCWQVLRRTGFVRVDDWLVGWTGHRGDRVFRISPAFRPLKPETHVEKTRYFHYYGREPE